MGVVSIFLLASMLLFCLGCQGKTLPLWGFSSGQQYVGSYLDSADIWRIGHALNTVSPRVPVQWENKTTGYQYSMMVFTSAEADGQSTRGFTVLAIAPSREAEVLNLSGRSHGGNAWSIVAQSRASRVGTAARMHLQTPSVPEKWLASREVFDGFPVVE
ncbi:hypothetical protein [Pseudodesulfovibrio piezophilus]|uniref:hypothetical protein n=1 Tax=Pseudodesulfovibrio piezophilus TaxID=879567 RepID=UPI0005A2890E|nr:hypothetical protein [Pseudodesulfovibrio piezophilus]